MLQLTPQSRVFLAREPADFRRGIDGLAALCRQRLGEDPMAGAIFVRLYPRISAYFGPPARVVAGFLAF